MSERELLGYTAEFHPAAHESRMASCYEALRGAPVNDLVALIESAREGLATRLAAGNLLALVGDPRIDREAPAMCDVPAAEPEVGLASDEVDAVLHRYQSLGVARGWFEKECPRHKVSLAAYQIGKYPVTNFEYREFLAVSGFDELPTSWFLGRYPQERSNHPVFGVSPRAADAYAAWLAARTGRRFRLPTEAEWEYAAAGPAGFEFPWGEGFETGQANTAEEEILNTTTVGLFPRGASPSGALDMAGNVEEYVADDYRPYPGGVEVRDDLFELAHAYRVARGGSYARFRDLARTRRRHGFNPLSGVYVMGFRLAEGL
jgi:formylglycine-generating enzyme required for sulfatase activity